MADLCRSDGLAFILGQALYMRAINGVKTKNDRVDSLKITRLIRGGNFPLADPLCGKTGRADRPHPEHNRPIQPAAIGGAFTDPSSAREGYRRAFSGPGDPADDSGGPATDRPIRSTDYPTRPADPGPGQKA